MKTKFFVLVTLLFLSSSIFAQDPNFYIYLCFGQSNMEGQAPIASQDRNVDDRFKVMQVLECSGKPDSTWRTAVPPLCQCWSKLSPADYFGRTMVANLPDSITVGVLSVAVGGCDIRLFDKDIYMDYDSTYAESWFTDKVKAYGWNPYEHLMKFAKLAQQDGVIKGILLHQGETNTGQAAWPGYVKKIYNDMLTDLSLNAEDVPLLAGEVLSEPGACCSYMNTIIARLPDTIPTSYVIPSDGCGTLPDNQNAHFDSEGYRTLGRRYGVTMLKTMGYEAIYAEAECSTVGDNWYIKADKDASNESYITAKENEVNPTSAPTKDASIVKMSFTLSKDTTYYMYGRFNNASTESDSYWIKVDDGDFILYDNLTTDGWQWLSLTNMELTAGEHTVEIAFAENGGFLDKVVLKNSERAPVSVGEEAEIVFEPNIYTALTEHEIEGYALNQNIPNPFIDKTSISFEIPVSTFVSLKILDCNGKEIKELAGKEFNAGQHNIEFSTDSLPSGNYFYTIKADSFVSTKTMVISAK